MWKPAAIVLGRPTRPKLSGPRLGQLSQSLMDSAARAVVSEAEPRVRAIVRDERSRLANAAIEGLPYVASAGAALLVTRYFTPADSDAARGAGYVLSAGLLAYGAWRALEEARGPEAPPPAPSGDGIKIPLLDTTTGQFAQAIVREAEPKVRALVDDERTKIGDAAEASLPFIGGAAAAFLGTAYLVPEKKPSWKFAGYMTSVAAFLFGTWRGLTVVSE